MHAFYQISPFPSQCEIAVLDIRCPPLCFFDLIAGGSIPKLSLPIPSYLTEVDTLATTVNIYDFLSLDYCPPHGDGAPSFSFPHFS